MNTVFDPNIDLVTAVDLNRQGTPTKPVYQFLYGSQLYGTLFGIYGTFSVASASDGSSCSINNATIYLYNYQGIINIGFTDHNPVYDPNDRKVYFGIKGTSMNRKKDILFDPALVIRKGEDLRLVFCRILYPLPGFEDTDLSDTRDLRGTLKDPVPDTPLFDTEFQARSGADYFNNPLRPGMLGCDSLTLESVRASPRVKFPSPRCTQSNVNLFF